MPEEAAEAVNKDTTETRILITEDRHGNFKVDYQMIIKGTEVTVPYRFSHLLGQMFLAMVIITFREYKKILGVPEKSNSKSIGGGVGE